MEQLHMFRKICFIVIGPLSCYGSLRNKSSTYTHKYMHMHTHTHMHKHMHIHTLSRYYRINPSMQKFINLMNETNACLINRVAKFVYKSFKTRTAYFSQHWNSYVYVVISTNDLVSVSVAWIFPGTPLKANGVPGSVRVTWQHSRSANCVLRYPA